MKEMKLPDIHPPICYKECRTRLSWIRDALYQDLDSQYLYPVLNMKKPDPFALYELFVSDAELRALTAETLLTAILWIEAGQPISEIMADSPHEIKCHLVRTVNLLDHWLSNLPEHRKEARADLGSMASAWTHLFVEFREQLRSGLLPGCSEPE